MGAFKGLLWKDVHISKSWLVINLIAEAVLLLTAYGVGIYTGDGILFVPIVLVTLLIFHFFFAPVILLQMLHLEGKTQLWLHNPQSSRRLLLSKMIVSTAYQFVSQIFLTIVGLFIYQYYFKTLVMIDGSFLAKALVLGNGALLLGGIYLSCIVVFFWSVYHSFSKYSLNKGLRWLIILSILIAYGLIEDRLGETKLFQAIGEAWTIPVPLDYHFMYDQGVWQSTVQIVEFSVFTLIYQIALSVVIFLIASRLLDRKVEV